MAQVLQQELLSIPGIAGAEVDQERGHAGVRVQLAEGADAEVVGAAVRRILVEHGMRPTPGEEESDDGPPPPPGAPGSVVSFPVVGEAHVVEPDVAEALESVAIEETPEGMSVLVRTSRGVQASRILDAAGTGLDDAVVSAVTELVGRGTVTTLGVADAEMAEHTVITVLLRRGDRIVTGSAVQQGGRAYAVARAVWEALEG